MEQLKLIILTIVNQNHSSSNILRNIFDNFNLENVNALFSSFPNNIDTYHRAEYIKKIMNRETNLEKILNSI